MTFNKPSFPVLPIIQKYVKTTIKGSSHWAICPFHQDTSPSLSISVEKNIFKCFACNIGGDAISFVMRIEKCSYVIAIKKIASILNLNPNDYLSSQENHNQNLLKINEIICNSYHKCLFNPKYIDQLNYLIKERGLSKKTIEKYRIGYAPEKDILENILNLYLKNNPSEKWGEEEIRKTGIFKYRKDGSKDAYFKERIIFPVFNSDNQVIAFSGRNIKEEGPKYLNIKTNEVFTKKNSLFNIQSLQKLQPIYIFEGFIDLLSCEQAGFSNGIACMGGTIDTGIFDEIKKFSSEIYLCLDNDESGHNFTINLSKSLFRYGFKVNIVNFLDSAHKDIDEFLKINKEKAIKALSSPICFFEWYYLKENKRSNLSNLPSFQIFLQSALNFLFTEINNETRLIEGIEVHYAKQIINTLFNFYKNLDSYESNNYSELINQRLQKYEKIILKSLIIEKNPQSNHYESIDSSIDYQRITNPFVKKAIKYQQLISYAQKNKEKICDKNNWHVEIPEKYLPDAKETKFIFDFLNNLKSHSSEIPDQYQEIWNFLKKYKNHSSSIKGLDDFFNKYYSFHQEYIQDLLNFLKKEKLSIEDRWYKNEELKKIYDYISSRASNFFFSSEFSKRK